MTPSTQILHGFLAPCLLSLLETAPDYGLALAQRLDAAGLGTIPGGTLYPALLRLEKQGLITASWQPSTSGPARKYFEITDAGRSALASHREEWASFSQAVGGIMSPRPVTPTAPAPPGCAPAPERSTGRTT